MFACAVSAAVPSGGRTCPLQGWLNVKSPSGQAFEGGASPHDGGGVVLQQGDFEEAAKLYRQAWEMLPDAPMSAAQKRHARDGFSAAAVANAKSWPLPDATRKPAPSCKPC